MLGGVGGFLGETGIVPTTFIVGRHRQWLKVSEAIVSYIRDWYQVFALFLLKKFKDWS